MALKKEDVLSVEIQSLNHETLFITDKSFDFPKVFDEYDNIVENVLMIKGKNLPELDRDKYIYVITFMKNGDRVQYKTTVSVSSYCQMNIILRPDQAQIMEERRRYFKIKTDEKGFITFITRGEETIRFPDPLRIYVKDLNLGGMFFTVEKSDIVFEKGDKLMAILNLQGSKLESVVEVLRVQELFDDQNHGYGSRFIRTTLPQEELISQFIYKQQLQARLKEKYKD